ncbi:HPr-rel-A system PqqD family peptide chaperone [Sphingomonas sp. 1P06PA]|uniref:HPr-rel-A system PqqD family peptide chaperone n=1 Tax=Sphingomonas sp. 1P06PA TaxID=554121 RepID=UPI0039A54CF4
MPIRYRADPPGACHSVAIDGLTLLYHRPSGQTHILADPAPALLAMLADMPADAEAIACRMGFADDAAMIAAIVERLAELEASGLVTRA